MDEEIHQEQDKKQKLSGRCRLGSRKSFPGLGIAGLWNNLPSEAFLESSPTNKLYVGSLLLLFFLFFPLFYFLPVSSLPSCRSRQQLQASSSSMTVQKPRGAEDNYYLQEWEEVREIGVQVTDTSDRYRHPEGISKRHLIFTYQQQACPTGKHRSPSQTPPFNCFELSIQRCLSPPQPPRVPLPHTCTQAPRCCLQQGSTMPSDSG